MRRGLGLLVGGVVTTSLLSGCVAAAAVPIVAAGGIYKSSQDSKKRKRDRNPQEAPQPAPSATAQTPEGQWQVTQLKQLPPPSGAPGQPPVMVTPAAGAAVPPGMQYLYGSGEAAALSVQAYQGLWSYVRSRALDRKTGGTVWSVVLARDGTLAAPKFTPCEQKPLAVVLDVDETALLNLGYEASDAQRQGPYDEKRWERWEQTGADKVSAVPGAVDALQGARREGVTVIFNSNRLAANAAQTEAALNGAGLGPAEHGKTLWLRGDDGTTSSAKDERRWQIADRYCVIALVGDQLGDFTDLFNKDPNPVMRRNAATETMIAPLWGAGWFMLPNPVYGSGLKGSFDEVFPADKRWNDPGEGAQP
jgi:5'-nucleotidase (lipoprotein e(P4) family)